MFHFDSNTNLVGQSTSMRNTFLFGNTTTVQPSTLFSASNLYGK
jgi:hypothetical protein